MEQVTWPVTRFWPGYKTCPKRLFEVGHMTSLKGLMTNLAGLKTFISIKWGDFYINKKTKMLYIKWPPCIKWLVFIVMDIMHLTTMLSLKCLFENSYKPFISKKYTWLSKHAVSKDNTI